MHNRMQVDETREKQNRFLCIIDQLQATYCVTVESDLLHYQRKQHYESAGEFGYRRVRNLYLES